MSYAGIGTVVEVDFTGGNPYIYPPSRPTYIRTSPPTDTETAVSLVLGVALVGLIGLAIWKAPKGAWTQPYYRPEPTVRIRVNRNKRRRRRRTSRRSSR